MRRAYPNKPYRQVARPHCGTRGAESGFTLVEALIALALTTMILLASTQLLFSMKHGTDRMRMKTETTHVARKALEYISYHVRTASDLNRAMNNPTAIMVWYEMGNNQRQASWNNVTNANLADVGTDILTVAVPVNGLEIRCLKWPGFQHAGNAIWSFDLGCPDSSVNVDLFQEMTGYDPATGKSPPLMVIGANGKSGFYQITNYLDNQNRGKSCSNPSTGKPGMHVVANPGNSDKLNPPGGQPALKRPVVLKIGVRFMTFRVRDGWLEQKQGLFDPNTDNPGTNFEPLLPQVEDFQVAWLFNDGTVWNTAAQQLPGGVYTNNVPAQGSSLQYDVINVVGLRISMTSRSNDEVYWESNPRFRRPVSEDHAASIPFDRLYHHRATDLAMIRNRVLQW